MRLKREMNATSSQDEFAKWAKLRRQHDKTLAEYEQKSMFALLYLFEGVGQAMDYTDMVFSVAQSLQTFKAQFDSAVGVLRWVGTNGLRMFIQFWFSKQPLFWLPRGWVPGYIEWILAFPRAPTGSISIQLWGIACASAISIVSASIVATWVLFVQQKGADEDKREPMKMGAGGGEGEKTTKARGREKKEL